MNYDNDIFIPKIWHVYRLLYQFNDKIHYYIAKFPKNTACFLISVSFARNAMQFNVCNGYAHLRSIC